MPSEAPESGDLTDDQMIICDITVLADSHLTRSVEIDLFCYRGSMSEELRAAFLFTTSRVFTCPPPPSTLLGFGQGAAATAYMVKAATCSKSED